MPDRRREWLARAAADAAVMVRAPGRVNLIGDHTDYQDGLCLPVAIDRDVLVAAAPRGDATIRAVSDAIDGEAAVDIADPPRASGASWSIGIAGVVGALHELGIAMTGARLALASSVPVGSGLSSSAACNVAVSMALSCLAGTDLHGDELARCAQRAEHLVGVPCGIMDQMASVHGRRGHALRIDCRSLQVEPIPLPTDLAIVVVHSGLPRALATSEYAARRAACEAAAARIGVPTLRDADLDSVRDDPIARHVVSENHRVEQLVGALRANDHAVIGAVLDTSHASLADDFRVSTPELDQLCAQLRAAGAIGARLTGAGFGGCVVALAPAAGAEEIARVAARRYRAATALRPTAFVANSADGAEVMGPRGSPAGG